MASPFVEDRSASLDMFAAPPRNAFEAYVSHAGKDLALRWGQFKRAARRQFGVFAGVSAIGIALGEAYAYFADAESAVVAVWAAFGVISGYSVAATRELTRNAIGVLSSVKRDSGYTVLAAAPEISKQSLRDLPPDKRTPFGCLLYQPASSFAAAIRDLQHVASQRQLVAFIGAIANEGASTSALCAAASAAQQGKEVLIVDCDLRRRSLTHVLDCDSSHGILEAAQQPANWRNYVQIERESGLHFIPAARVQNPWRGMLFGQPGFTDLLNRAREHYDLIVLDCPPALTVNDGAMIARSADSCIIVAAWDETPMVALRATMRALRNRSPIPTGVVVNRMPAHYRFDASARLH